MVTNPGTRNWTVTGSLFATLNDMFGNRTICGIGRGDSAMRVLGHTPSKLATLSESMEVIKGLAEGREVTYNGTQQQIPWAGESELKILMAAYGPKALHLCGSETDGFILQLADPQIAEWTIAAVQARPPRRPAAIPIRSTSASPRRPMSATTSPTSAISAAGSGAWSATTSPTWSSATATTAAPVPQALTDYIKGREGYDYSGHGKAGHDHTDFVPDEIIDRFCILGDRAAHIAASRSCERSASTSSRSISCTTRRTRRSTPTASASSPPCPTDPLP